MVAFTLFSDCLRPCAMRFLNATRCTSKVRCASLQIRAAATAIGSNGTRNSGRRWGAAKQRKPVQLAAQPASHQTESKKSHSSSKSEVLRKGKLSTPSQAPRPNCLDAAAEAIGGIAKVVIKSGKARLFRDGNPMVYPGAIDRVVGRPPPAPGASVLLQAGNGETFAWGIFNPDSLFRVRVLQSVADAERFPEQALNVPRLLEARIRAAGALRKSIGLPSDHTTVYRLINSEGDRLSGLAVDVLGDTLVVASSSLFIEMNKHLVVRLLSEVTGLADVVWRPHSVNLGLEGWRKPSADGTADAAEDTAASESRAQQLLEGNSESEAVTPGIPDSVAESVEMLENGMRLLASPYGQKTGFYVDQRDSRQLIRQLAAGRTVLDLCTYTGGFAISAALGGAKSVVGVDTSKPALDLARRNAELNGVEDRCIFLNEDIMQVMKDQFAKGLRFDIVILDPPKLAPTRNSLTAATRRYRSLNSMAVRLVSPEGGLLMTCSCSAAMTQSNTFIPTTMGAAAAAGRTLTLLRNASASLDHPANPAYLESIYLTNLLYRVT
mmetsp:Transcript_12067/g.36210  ORF Transcript_12067/g.36210 Transcript_12067/m.36210 type:complete len:551 (+) Transcript_12067:168-1820(+)